MGRARCCPEPLSSTMSSNSMLRAATAPSATPWPLPSPFLFVLDCHPSLPALSLCPSALPRQALSLLAHSKHRLHFMENHCNGCAAHRITVHSLTQNLPSVCSHRVWEGEFKQWGVLRGGGKIPLNSHFKAEIADLREKGDLKKKKMYPRLQKTSKCIEKHEC